MFTNNLISGSLSKEPILKVVTGKMSLIGGKISREEFILLDGLKFIAIDTIFEECKFTLVGKFGPDSMVTGCTFFNCDINGLQENLNGFGCTFFNCAINS